MKSLTTLFVHGLPCLLLIIVCPATGAESGIREDSKIPFVRFTDITESAGIRFTHVHGALGEKLLPETMGGGCGFVDVDSDGDPDLILVNSTRWDGGVPALSGPGLPTSALFLNDGAGRFRDATVGSGLDVPLYGMGLAAGDYDNDGAVDVFISGVGGNRLFRNQGRGRFRDVTAEAGLRREGLDWGTSCGWLDYDRDGLLDLVVCQYVQWSRAHDLAQSKRGAAGNRVYGPPFAFDGAYTLLYRNRGGGRFVEVTSAAGLKIKNPQTGKPAAKALGLAPVDLNLDGWIDFIVANDTVPNHVFVNQKNGTFKEMGGVTGLAYDGFGNVRGAMGIDVAWFSDDHSLGVAIANFAQEMNTLYVAKAGSMQFTDEAPFGAMGPASRPLLKFGLLFFDYDLDGWPDLLTANGHLDEQVSKAYAQPAQLFWNGGPQEASNFHPVSEKDCGPDLFQKIVGRGAAFADIDGDGDLDVCMTQVGGKPLLLRNDQQLGNRWLRVKLIGKKTHRDAIGTRIDYEQGGGLFRVQVMPTRSYLSQSELPVTLGFGRRKLPERLLVHWPRSGVQEVVVRETDRLIVVQEGGGVSTP